MIDIDSAARGRLFIPVPVHPLVQSALNVDGVHIYSGEYVEWKLSVDYFTNQITIVGYEICSYGIGSRID